LWGTGRLSRARGKSQGGRKGETTREAQRVSRNHEVCLSMGKLGRGSGTARAIPHDDPWGVRGASIEDSGRCLGEGRCPGIGDRLLRSQGLAHRWCSSDRCVSCSTAFPLRGSRSGSGDPRA
jgi:hypothetical protein